MKIEITNVSVELVSILLELLPSENKNSNEILAKAGIFATKNDLREGKITSISRIQFSTLFREVFITLTQGNQIFNKEAWLSNEEFRMLCYCVIHCKTLADVIAQAILFFRMLRRHDIALTINTDMCYARFEYRLHCKEQSMSALICDLLSLSYSHRFFNWLIGESIVISEMNVIYQELLPSNSLIDLFQSPIHFGQEGNYFDFPVDVLDRPIKRTPEELESFLELELFPFDLFFDGVSCSSLSDLIAQQFRRKLAKNKVLPNLEQLATYYNLSEATLRRRLASENNSISLIKDHCRLELALDLLANKTDSIEDIAHQLGFSDASTFRRAFKVWQGMSPSLYRREVTWSSFSLQSS